MNYWPSQGMKQEQPVRLTGPSLEERELLERLQQQVGLS